MERIIGNENVFSVMEIFQSHNIECVESRHIPSFAEVTQCNNH